MQSIVNNDTRGSVLLAGRNGKWKPSETASIVTFWLLEIKWTKYHLIEREPKRPTHPSRCRCTAIRGCRKRGGVETALANADPDFQFGVQERLHRLKQHIEPVEQEKVYFLGCVWCDSEPVVQQAASSAASAGSIVACFLGASTGELLTVPASRPKQCTLESNVLAWSVEQQ